MVFVAKYTVQILRVYTRLYPDTHTYVSTYRICIRFNNTINRTVSNIRNINTRYIIISVNKGSSSV